MPFKTDAWNQDWTHNSPSVKRLLEMKPMLWVHSWFEKRAGRGATFQPLWHSGKLLLLIIVHPDFAKEVDGIISKQVLLPICFCENKCPQKLLNGRCGVGWRVFCAKSVPSALKFRARTGSWLWLRKLQLYPVFLQSSLLKEEKRYPYKSENS